MTEAEQIELLAWNEYRFGPQWARDEFELRQRAVEVVDFAFAYFDGRQTRPVEVATMTRTDGGYVGDFDTMPIAPQAFERRFLRLFAGLKREEALLIAEEFLRG